MSLIIGFLTFVLVVDCLFLILLILIQLPKKEAGAGIAFGGAAADALFGAGQGNALTKMTKYAASFFVMMAVLLSVLNMHAARASGKRLEQEIQKQASTPAAAPAKPLLPTPAMSLPTPEAPATNATLTSTNPAPTLTTQATAATNSAPAANAQQSAPAANPSAPATTPAAPAK